MLSSISLIYVIICMLFMPMKSISAEQIQCYPPLNVTFLVLGEDFTLKCVLNLTVATPDKNPNVRWTKNDQPLVKSDNMDILSVKNSERRHTFSLKFTSVNFSDTGNYTCQYRIGTVLGTSDIIHLVVQPEPTEPVCVTSKPFYFHGENVTLQCQSFTYNKLKLYWKNLPQALLNSAGFKNASDGYRSMTTIFFVVEKHLGEVEYTCVMEVTGMGYNGQFICNLKIIVKSKLDVKIRKTVHGHRTFLECLEGTIANESTITVPSKDGLEIIWSSNNFSVNKSINANKRSRCLVVHNFTSNKIGKSVVTCTVYANNSEGSASIVLSDNSRTTTESLLLSTRYISLTSQTVSEPTLMSTNLIYWSSGSHQEEYSTVAIMSAAISMALVSVMLVSIKYINIKCRARRRNEQLQLGHIQAIRTNNSTIHVVPLPVLGASTASVNTLRNYLSQLSVGLLDSVHGTSILSSRTGVPWIHHGRSTDSLPSLPEVISFESRSVSYVETENDDGMNTVESQVEVLGEPVYDEIKDESLIAKRSEQFLLCDSDGVIIRNRAMEKPYDKCNQPTLMNLTEMFLDSQYNELNDNTINTETHLKELQEIHSEEKKEHAGAIEYPDSMTTINPTTGKPVDERNPRVVDIKELLSDSQYSELNGNIDTIDNHYNESQKKRSDVLIKHTRTIHYFDSVPIRSPTSENPVGDCNQSFALYLDEALSDPEYDKLSENTDNTEENVKKYQQKRPRGIMEHPEKCYSTDREHTINVNRPIPRSTDDINGVKVMVDDVPDGRGFTQVYQLHSVPIPKEHRQEPKIAGSLGTTINTSKVKQSNKTSLLYATINRKYKRETLDIPEENVHVAQDVNEDIKYKEEIRDAEMD